MQNLLGHPAFFKKGIIIYYSTYVSDTIIKFFFCYHGKVGRGSVRNLPLWPLFWEKERTKLKTMYGRPQQRKSTALGAKSVYYKETIVLLHSVARNSLTYKEQSPKTPFLSSY